MRILNIVENLDKGAVENWLVNVFIESRKIRPDWEWTFYCILGKPGKLDERVKEAGGTIIYSPCTVSQKFKFLSALRKILRIGNYDILHSHHDYLSGFYLPSSRGLRFKKRILHVHNTDAALPIGNKTLHNLLLNPFRRLAIHFSDQVVGISNHTLSSFVKSKLSAKKKGSVLYYGIDMGRFADAEQSDKLRRELSIPPAAKLLLFSGRMNELKNPLFVVDILKQLLAKDKNWVALFVGEGYLLKKVEERAASYQLTDHIRIMGWRTDLPAIMKAADVMVFPRLEKPMEGLGLVVVEAQAAGLPMITTSGIPGDAIEIPELVHVLPLNNNPETWAEKIMTIERTMSREDALKIMMKSKFALPIATKNLVSLYED